jgi:hypothetical protein
MVLGAALIASASAVGAEEAPNGDGAADAESALFEQALFDSVGSPEGGAAPESGTEAAPAPARIDYLVGGTVVAAAKATLSGGADSYLAEADASGKLFAKVAVPDYGALFASYNLTHPFLQAFGGNGTPPAADDPYQPTYELSELHYSFDIAKRLFVRVGNQLISWGPSRIWTPVDFINLKKIDAFADFDSRVGKPGMRLHYLLPKGNLFAFVDFSGLSEDGKYGDPAEDLDAAGRLDFTAGSFEYGVTVYGGTRSSARFGLDASGRLLGSTVYGEAAATASDGDEDAYYRTALGFSRSLDDLKRWTLSAEGFFNSAGEDLTGYSAAEMAVLPAERKASLYQGRWYAYASVSGEEFPFPNITATLTTLANLTDGSYSVKLSGYFEIPRAVPFTLALAYAGGGDEREFTRYGGNGTLALTASTKLEF